MELLEMIICVLGALFHIMHYIHPHKKPKTKKPQAFLKIKVLYKFIFAFKG